MSIQLLLYFGILAFIGVGAFVLFIVISIRSDKKESQKRQKRQKTTISGAYRMQVILPEAGKPLIWLANGFAYQHPNEMEDTDDISALTEFMAKLQDASPNTTISLSKNASLEAAPAISPSISEVEEAKISEETQKNETAPAETPVSPPATAPLAEQRATDHSPIGPDKLPVSPALSYEEQMELPFLERLRSSFFGQPARPAPRKRSSNFQPSQVATIPKLDELEEIVHKQLANMPEAPLISIRTGNDGLLEIVVDNQSYERIDDIPDDTIRQAMHKSVKIWESRM
jgi:hypothetical protein